MSEDADSWGGNEFSQRLEKAALAARKGDAPNFYLHLGSTPLMDGLVRVVQRKWGGLPPEEVREAVATAMQQTYERVRRGPLKVDSLGRYLVKASDNQAKTIYNRLSRETAAEPAELDGEGVWEGDHDEEVEERRERMRNQAVREARRLLPRLGQETAQAVMSYLIDAVEAGVHDVSNQEIAGALGLTVGTVKVSKRRAFDRLGRIANEEGLGDQLLKQIEEDIGGKE
jgi:RNA polymerase sigma factor (sigma-70 family)